MRCKPAQGNALGFWKKERLALKGRNIRCDALSRPFRARSVFSAITQGAALGWFVAHLWCFDSRAVSKADDAFTNRA